ncbi:MAG: hypothetical protein HY319_29845 [Armatimonadetes bacterium]|nr:hypothetical protein [Armatimonadota bacterium]
MRRVLSELQVPRTLEQLARQLEVDPAVVESMLGLLLAKGYVGHAYDRSPTCGTTCGGCSVHNLCPARGEEAPFRIVWRLTFKGIVALEQRAGAPS